MIIFYTTKLLWVKSWIELWMHRARIKKKLEFIANKSHTSSLAGSMTTTTEESEATSVKEAPPLARPGIAHWWVNLG